MNFLIVKALGVLLKILTIDRDNVTHDVNDNVAYLKFSHDLLRKGGHKR